MGHPFEITMEWSVKIMGVYMLFAQSVAGMGMIVSVWVCLFVVVCAVTNK